MNITFRSYEEKDFNDLKEMIFALYAEDPEGEPMTEAKIKATVNESIVHPEKVKLIMIYADGKIVIGYGIIVMFWSNEYGGNIVNIDELYVKEAYRNKQIATSFIKHQKTAYPNSVALQLEATPSNGTAMRLYNRLGFELSANSHLMLVLTK